MRAAYTVEHGLARQGYVGYSPAELASLDRPLRFTPLICMFAVLAGLALQAPWIHFTLAVFGAVALPFSSHHPFDMLYNHAVRRLTGGAKLPPNPLPRRVAFFVCGCGNLCVGLLFAAGSPAAAYWLGGLLAASQLVLAGTNFCVFSMLMEAGFSLYGRRLNLISGEQARRLVEQGAQLVDVRSVEEFAEGRLAGSLNIPVQEIETRIGELRDTGKPLVIYCAAGVRSHKAAELLKRSGVEQVHELGMISRW